MLSHNASCDDHADSLSLRSIAQYCCDGVSSHCIGAGAISFSIISILTGITGVPSSPFFLPGQSSNQASHMHILVSEC